MSKYYDVLETRVLTHREGRYKYGMGKAEGHTHTHAHTDFLDRSMHHLGLDRRGKACKGD